MACFSCWAFTRSGSWVMLVCILLMPARKHTHLQIDVGVAGWWRKMQTGLSATLYMRPVWKKKKKTNKKMLVLLKSPLVYPTVNIFFSFISRWYIIEIFIHAEHLQAKRFDNLTQTQKKRCCFFFLFHSATTHYHDTVKKGREIVQRQKRQCSISTWNIHEK